MTPVNEEPLAPPLLPPGVQLRDVTAARDSGRVVPQPQLEVKLGQLDHPSGIYYARELAKGTLWVDNPSSEPLTLQGEVVFGEVVESAGSSPPPPAGKSESGTGGNGDEFKKLSITPLTATVIAPGKRAKVEVSGLVGPPGRYEFRWNQTRILSPSGLEVRCIYPPHAAGKGETEEAAPGTENPSTTLPQTRKPALWVMRMPRPAANNPDYLADFSKRTGINRFVLEDTWPIPQADTADGHLRFGGPLALTAGEFQELLTQAQQAKVHLIFRVTLHSPAPGEAAQLKAFHEHIAALLKVAGNSVQAMIINMPSSDPAALPPPSTIASYYLAAYDAAKKHNKNIVMLGLGSVSQTKAGLLDPLPGQVSLAPYVDALGTSMKYGELWRLHQPDLKNFLAQHPLWILPSPPHENNGDAIPDTVEVGNSATPWEMEESPAIALAQVGVGAEGLKPNDKNGVAGGGGGLRLAAVPVPDLDRGVTLHLFGEAVFYQRIRPELPLFIGVFQGNDYAVAAVAGLGAGAPNDLDWPNLPLNSHGILEIADDADEMRVVDERGYPVACRIADVLRIPLDHQVRYVLKSGSAEELNAMLHAGEIRNMPLLEVREAELVAADASQNLGDRLKIRIRNATRYEAAGEIKVYLAEISQSEANHPLAVEPVLLGRGSFKNLASAEAVELMIGLTQLPPASAETRQLRLEISIGKEQQQILVTPK